MVYLLKTIVIVKFQNEIWPKGECPLGFCKLEKGNIGRVLSVSLVTNELGRLIK